MTKTREQSRDTGMAMVLLLLIAAMATKRDGFVIAAAIAQVVVMAAPGAFRPLAVAWFGLSHVLGYVSSRVLLTAVFALVVTPVGVARRLMGKDALRLRSFKRGRASVLVVRNHTFTAGDLEKPY